MHFEILIEDSSGKRLVEILMPQFIGPYGAPHTWRLHSYRGVGRLPSGLKPNSDATKRVLLDQMPRLLRGFTKSGGVDKVVIVVDSDNRQCHEFLKELQTVARQCGVGDKALFRLAIEEIEAWYFGDRTALHQAYPRAKAAILNRYVQDSICGTWELLADAVYSGGAKAVKKQGWPKSGDLKHEWAEKIAPYMNADQNSSPSFCKLRDGLRRLIS